MPRAPELRGEELQGLILKTAGVADVVRGALDGTGERIAWAFIYGSFAKQEEKQKPQPVLGLRRFL